MLGSDGLGKVPYDALRSRHAETRAHDEKEIHSRVTLAFRASHQVLPDDVAYVFSVLVIFVVKYDARS